MSNAPYLLPRVREGLRMGDGKVVDSLINDGLWCSFENCHMGISGEVVAEKYSVSRDEQDRYAAESHRKAAHATREGWFKDEILPIDIPQRKGDAIVVDTDEPIREDTTAAALAKLKPAFKKDGSVTAGNAPGVNDAAAAVVIMAAEKARALGLTPMARIVGQATSGLAPKLVMMTPVEAVRKVATKVGWELEGRRPLRDQRGVLGPGRRGHARAQASTRRGSTCTAAPSRSATRSAPAARGS